MKNKLSIKFNPYTALLIILILLVVISNFIWLKISQAPPIGDGLKDLIPGIDFYLDITQRHFSFKDLLKNFQSFSTFTIFTRCLGDYIRSFFSVYPPLVRLSFSLFYFLFGIGSGMEIMVHSLYLAIALLAIYGIGKKILNEKAGLLAAFIFSSFPGVISFSRTVYAEFVLMCMVSLTLFTLLKTDYFRNRKYSVLLGISLGLTALAKWEFPAFLSGPFALFLWRSFSSSGKPEDDILGREKNYINFALTLIIALLIASPWYVVSFKNVFMRLSEVGRGTGFVPHENDVYYSNLYLLKKITFYPLTIINVYIGFFFFLLVVVSGIIFVYKIIKKIRQPSLRDNQFFYVSFLASWVIVAYLCYSFIRLQTPSHIMSVLPALAIIIGIGIFSLKNRIARLSMILLIILYGIASHLHSFVDFGKFGPLYKLKLYLDGRGRLSLITSEGYWFRDNWEINYRLYPPYNRDWKIKEILSFIKDDSRSLGHKPIVLILCPHIEFIFSSHQYYNLINNYQLFIEPGHGPAGSYKDPSRFDYIVIGYYTLGMNEGILMKITSEMPHLLEAVGNVGEFKKTFFDKYKLIKEYLLPDDIIAKIYKLTKG